MISIVSIISKTDTISLLPKFPFRITPSKQRDDMEVMTLHPDITIGQGVVMEAWLTFILMQTIWGSINSRRRRVLSPSIPIGLAYVVDILAGVRIY